MDLLKYINDAANRRRTGGIRVSGLPVGTDVTAYALATGAANRARSDPSFTTTWVVSSEKSVILNAAQLLGIEASIQHFVSAMYAAEAQANAGATADPPTVTNTLDVDRILLGVKAWY